MADSTTNLDPIASSQSSKEVTANAFFDAASPATLFGRRAVTCGGLTWGYYGGKYRKADGTLVGIANGTVTLTASATNYIKETDGVVSVTTAAPTGWPSPLSGGAKALYAVVCDASGATSYTDERTTGLGSGNSAGATTATGVSIADAGNYFASTNVEGALQELGAGGGTTAATISALIHAASEKTTPVDADELALVDSAASNALKKFTWADLKATLKAYLDTLYAPLAQPFDMHSFYPGVPTASAKIYRGKLARSVTFPANFAGSQFTGSANATGSTVFNIQKNGTTVGTCTVAAGSVTPTYASTGGTAVTFAAGDILSIVAPSTADATLSDPAFTLAGTR